MARQVNTTPHRTTGLPLRALRVEVKEGADAGKRFVSESDVITIGTAEGNDLVLTDETVSRYHLELRRKADRIIVQDHGSTNGTELGSALLEKATIAPGTTLKLGKTIIRVTDGDIVTLELHDADRLGGLRGRSPEMRELMARIKRAASTDLSVLILGETGTGKEVIAHAVHEVSARADKPFETVDCGALTPTLIASELFGHEKGAFTGADHQHIGAFERANGGTIFLDEIGELPQPLQAALLGALERRSFRRLGGQKQISVDVRIISATNRDLRSEVNAGRFRSDLYFRLAVFLIRVPPLREHAADIPILVEHFLREGGFDGDVNEIIGAEPMQALKAHSWPGNVRELRNVVESALAAGEARIDPPAEGQKSGEAKRTSDFPSIDIEELARRPYKAARAMVLEEFEYNYLTRLMERAGNNVSKAAREAKMHRTYLIEMLKRHSVR